MTNQEIEYTVIANAIATLCAMCPFPSDKVVDIFTGVLWDEEEAGGIKEKLRVQHEPIGKKHNKSLNADEVGNVCPICGDPIRTLNREVCQNCGCPLTG